MSESKGEFTLAPLTVSFDTDVELTIHSAFLATARLLQCDPIARVSLLTLHKSLPTRVGNGGDATAFVTAREVPLGATRRHHFTARPDFNETLHFTIPSDAAASLPPGAGASSEQRLLITLEDALGCGFGEASLPFPPPAAFVCPTRRMLHPRRAHNRRDALFRADIAALARDGADDFGFVSLSCRATCAPRGGARFSPPQNPSSCDALPFPVGLVLRAVWLLPHDTAQRAARVTTSVEFGGADRFLFDGAEALFLTLPSAPPVGRAVVHCALHPRAPPAAALDVATPLPLPPLTGSAAERDVWWTAAVGADKPRNGAPPDLGLLLVSMRWTRRPLGGPTPACPDAAHCAGVNDPVHQALLAHGEADWGRAPPDVPSGAYRRVVWESAAHMARATERRWKRDCLARAKPTAAHVRHVWDVHAGRAALDPGVARVAAVFFNQSHAGGGLLTPGEVRQLLVACAFHAEGMNVMEAARFCFFALRREMEEAIPMEDVIFLLEHALIGRTVEMPLSEVRRRVGDIFGNTPHVTFEDFTRYFVRNYAMWYAFGVPITTADGSTPHAFLGELPNQTTHPDSTHRTVTDAASTTKNTLAVGGADGDAVWRTFVARVQHSHKAFSVTAHVGDSVADVMVMVQNSTGIRAACQEWRVNGNVVDAKATIGATELGLTRHGGNAPELIIIAREEAVRVVMVYREKNVRWEVRLPVNEKVLKLRVLVQQKTMIPLSRCVLRNKGVVLVDRHQLAHYSLQDGDVVDIVQE